MKIIRSRRAFTIVELVIVIAVVAVLASVLVPAFGDVIANARDSAAKQNAKNAYTSYMAENAAAGKLPELFLYQAEEGRVVAVQNGAAGNIYGSMDAAMEAILGDAYDPAKLVPTSDGKLFAYGGEVPVPDDPAAEDTDWSGATAVFVGDSITQASGIAVPYHELVESALGLVNYRHMGIAGSCFSAETDYGHSPEPLIDRYTDIPDADLIVIFMGTNDFGHGTPLGTINDSSDGSFYGALNEIIPGVQAVHPNSQLVVVTPMHRVGFNSSAMTGGRDDVPNKPYGKPEGTTGATLAQYVDAIKNICEKYNVYVIDLFNEEALDPNDSAVNSALFNDGLHPNDDGHAKLAEVIADKLKKIPCVRKSGGVTPEEPDVEDGYALRIGNRFGGASYENDSTRACTKKNVYLKAGTVITMKDEAKYDWAVSKENSDSSTTESDYYFSPRWDEAAYRIIAEDGYYGFALKEKDNAVFDFSGETPKDLLDYFEIAETLAMVQGNRMIAGNPASTRQSSLFNLYLQKGTIIRFAGGNGATGWALSTVLGNTNEISNGAYATGKSNGGNGSWATAAETTFTVPADGYYGFVVQFTSDTPVSETYTLLDYFEITGYTQ